MNNKLTMHDIAREASVSISTVSRVLTGSIPVREDTRKRVMEVVEKHSFRPSSVARSLKVRRSKAIGFIVPDITNPFYSQLFLEVEVLASRNGYTVILCNSHSDYKLESHMLDVLLEREVEAIVFTGGRVDYMMLTKKYIHEMEKINQIVPLITCSAMPGTKCMQLMNNERKGIFQLVEHLASLGHHKIGMVGGRLDVRQGFQRRQYFLEAAEEFDVTVDRRWLIEGDFTIASGRECMTQLLGQSDLPTAVMAFNDVAAVGALGVLLKHHISVPHDMALTGFDGIHLTEAVTPSITTMTTPFEKYAEKILEIVINKADAGRITECMLDMQLTVRESTVSSEAPH